MSAPDTECPLIGTWKLVGWEIVDPDDPTIAPPPWEHKQGQIMYSADGYMAVQMSNAERAPFADDNYGATDAERIQAYNDFIAYCGRYRWEGDRVIHIVEQSEYPNIIGTEQVRLMTLDGDRLILNNVNRSIPLTWQRVRSPES